MGTDCATKTDRKRFLHPFQFPGWENNPLSKSLFFPLNEKIVTANPSDCVSAAVILKRDSENFQMAAVDYSSVHLSSVLYHQSSDPHPHVGICSGEDDLLKWASGQGKKIGLHLECGEKGCWCRMVKRPKVSWFVYLINVSWTKGREKNWMQGAKCKVTATCSTSIIWDFQRLVVPKRSNIQRIHVIQRFYWHFKNNVI